MAGWLLLAGGGCCCGFGALDLHQLVDPFGVSTAFELGTEERHQNLVGQRFTDDASADAEHVGVVVLASQSRGEKVVAQSSAHAVHLVRSELFALTTAPDDDADVGVAIPNRPRDGRTDRGVVDRLGAVRALIDDVDAGALEHLDEVLLQQETGVV